MVFFVFTMIPRMRAYHLQEHVMYTPILGISLDEVGTITWVQITPTKNVPGDRVKVMLATGLLDQDEEEIFEHDLVTIDAEGEHFYGEIYYDTKRAGFSLRDELGEETQLFSIDKSTRKIVGNSFENPFPLKAIG